MKIDRRKSLRWILRNWSDNEKRPLFTGNIFLKPKTIIAIGPDSDLYFTNQADCIKEIKEVAAALGLKLKKEPVDA